MGHRFYKRGGKLTQAIYITAFVRGQKYNRVSMAVLIFASNMLVISFHQYGSIMSFQ
jgi:hypothetical protein